MVEGFGNVNNATNAKKLKLSVALKSIEGICRFYWVSDYVLEDGLVAVYNCQNDNFHLFRWSVELKRYLYSGSKDYILNWRKKRMAV